jgi:DNA polymerase
VSGVHPAAPSGSRTPAPPGAAPAKSDHGTDPIFVGTSIDEAAAATHARGCASLDEVAAAVARCTLCTLSATARNHVPGEGNRAAKFVCVGEAPGQTEDETGRPFVGAAGQLLTKILAAIEFARGDVFICNVLKHRPPGNRNPHPDEIAACSPFLLQQLALLKPHVILALGTFAAQTLLQTTRPIGKLRGQIHRFYGVPLIVTYHPAALLRNSNWKRPAWEDVQLAKRVFDNAGA